MPVSDPRHMFRLHLSSHIGNEDILYNMLMQPSYERNSDNQFLLLCEMSAYPCHSDHLLTIFLGRFVERTSLKISFFTLNVFKYTVKALLLSYLIYNYQEEPKFSMSE